MKEKGAETDIDGHYCFKSSNIHKAYGFARFTSSLSQSHDPHDISGHRNRPCLSKSIYRELAFVYPQPQI